MVRKFLNYVQELPYQHFIVESLFKCDKDIKDINEWH